MLTAKETLNLLNKQWCSSNDIQEIGQTSKKNARRIKRTIEEDLKKEGYLLPTYLVPTTAVIKYLNIDIPYLESRVLSENNLNNLCYNSYESKALNSCGKRKELER